ncbi:PilW family protein [Argonema antarcticum]|uniref:PilW family protein n=1 Tax=Argonema antarcticum TaxID=2942763 RepID=UPI002011D087|nr:prepilin-type N-terminal cleavage/methylation domain-containing protein [Argonema antarcticum]MCL1471497.1 prepilin-type N-terminal cleavage/methylation domain-containing protein [Argonema antarcticum A004/B2]
MKAKLLKILRNRLIAANKKLRIGNLKNSGFTILELLVAVVISTVVMIALVDMITDLLRSDRTEFGRNETQREMQMAVDMMVSDLREAAYVYSGKEINQPRTQTNGVSIPALKNYLPAFSTPNVEPVLVFWKVDPVPYNQTDPPIPSCTGFADGTPKRQECNLLQIKRRSYTLVAYLFAPNQPNDDKWKGKSRLMRYEVRKYQNIAALEQSTGYLDPTTQNVSFQTWPLQGDGLTPPGGGARLPDTPAHRPVLVDFVDYSRIIVSGTPQSIEQINDQPCPDPSAASTEDNHSRVPENRDTYNSFFVCVSPSSYPVTNPATGEVTLIQANQDVLIFLRGNPTGRAGIKVAPLLTIKTQAVARGVVNKTPD